LLLLLAAHLLAAGGVCGLFDSVLQPLQQAVEFGPLRLVEAFVPVAPPTEFLAPRAIVL
jgi:hypothetical protein